MDYIDAILLARSTKESTQKLFRDVEVVRKESTNDILTRLMLSGERTEVILDSSHLFHVYLSKVSHSRRRSLAQALCDGADTSTIRELALFVVQACIEAFFETLSSDVRDFYNFIIFGESSSDSNILKNGARPEMTEMDTDGSFRQDLKLLSDSRGQIFQIKDLFLDACEAICRSTYTSLKLRAIMLPPNWEIDQAMISCLFDSPRCSVAFTSDRDVSSLFAAGLFVIRQHKDTRVQLESRPDRAIKRYTVAAQSTYARYTQLLSEVRLLGFCVFGAIADCM